MKQKEKRILRCTQRVALRTVTCYSVRSSVLPYHMSRFYNTRHYLRDFKVTSSMAVVIRMSCQLRRWKKEIRVVSLRVGALTFLRWTATRYRALFANQTINNADKVSFCFQGCLYYYWKQSHVGRLVRLTKQSSGGRLELSKSHNEVTNFDTSHITVE